MTAKTIKSALKSVSKRPASADRWVMRLFDKLKGAKVFVVDDSRAFLAGLKELMKPYGCVVETVTDPTKAIEAAIQFRPDVMIIDFEMPSISGPELVSKMKQMPELKGIPAAILTGSTDSNHLFQALEQGADAFILKETAQTLLAPKLCTLIRLKSLYDELKNIGQTDAIKALIGTYKHEFGNILTVMNGNIYKLELQNGLAEDPALKKIKECCTRFEDVLKKLNELRTYQEQDYANSSKIVKIA